jgi:cytoskeletal protein CcmA (bactofilin family)
MRKSILIILGLALLVAPISALAFEARNAQSVVVGKDEVVDGNLFAAGSSIQIDGTVKGDVFCAGQTVSITGMVEGNVFCAGQSLSISSQIDGDLIGAGQNLNFKGDVARNLIFAGQNITTDSDSAIGWQAILAGASVDLSGPIEQDLLAAGANFRLAGAIGRNADLWLDRTAGNSLTIAPTGLISGDLTYHALSEANIEPGSQILGKTDFKKLAPLADRHPQGAWAGKWLFGTLASFLIGLLFILVWPRKIRELSVLLRDGTNANFGWGLALTVLTPLAALILMFTLIGLPLAFLVLILWLVLMWLGKILASLYIGGLVTEKWLPSKKKSLYWQLGTGLIVSYFFFSLPFIGGLASFIAIIYGLGTLYLFSKES